MTGQPKMHLRWSSIMVICVNMVQGLSIHFRNPKPFHVALGRELVLEAVVEKIAAEKVFMVTWECNTKTGARRLATYPGKTQERRISMEREGATLRISDVQESDFGRYTITVTDIEGRQTSAVKDVWQNADPPDASITLLCAVSGEKHQWDIPVVTWLVDGVELTNQMANMSDGGSKLYLHVQEAKGHNYTCISDSSLGTSIAYFTIPVPDKCQLYGNKTVTESHTCRMCSTTIIVAVASIVLVTGMVLLFKKANSGSRSIKQWQR